MQLSKRSLQTVLFCATPHRPLSSGEGERSRPPALADTVGRFCLFADNTFDSGPKPTPQNVVKKHSGPKLTTLGRKNSVPNCVIQSVQNNSGSNKGHNNSGHYQGKKTCVTQETEKIIAIDDNLILNAKTENKFLDLHKRKCTNPKRLPNHHLHKKISFGAISKFSKQGKYLKQNTGQITLSPNLNKSSSAMDSSQLVTPPDLYAPSTSQMSMDQDGFQAPKRFFRPQPAPSTPVFTTNNPFSVLPIQTNRSLQPPSTTDTTQLTHYNITPQDMNTTQTTKTTKNPSTPTLRGNIGSFYIENLHDARNMIATLKKVCTGQITAQNTKDFLIVRPSSIKDHASIEKCLRQLKITEPSASFYFHRATNEKRHKLVLKGLSPNIPPQEIKEDIESQGFIAFHVTELMKKEARNSFKHLAIYVVEIQKDQTGEFKNKVRYVCDHKISIEELLNNDRVPHCQKCQMWGHSKNYCERRTTCPVCAGSHELKDCPRPEKPTCANCQQDHVASFSGCPALIHLKREREKQLEKARESRNAAIEARQMNNRKTTSVTAAPPPPPLTNTFANILTGSTPSQPTTNTPLQPSNIENPILSFINSLNFTKLLSAFHEIIAIIKGPGDVMSKILLGINVIKSAF